jgi:phage tail P2-like protein
MAASVTDSLLPINATAQEQALEGATARVSDVPVLVRESWDPDTCPSALLPWLASAFSVDAWDATWSDDQKRQAIRDSVYVHRHKGTIGAVKRALSAIGFSAQVQEWFNQQPPAAPGTFRLLLTADQVGFSLADIDRIVSVVDSTKNLRSHLDVIVPAVVTRSTLTVAAVAHIGTEITVKPGDTAGFFLMQEGASNGVQQTEQAVDQLHAELAALAGSNYW